MASDYNPIVSKIRPQEWAGSQVLNSPLLSCLPPIVDPFTLHTHGILAIYSTGIHQLPPKMTQSPSHYPGLPLKAERKEIRVLELLPTASDYGFEASCLLHTVSLLQEPKPHYSALSYAWGDPTATKPILLNGRAHNVTENLAAVLKFLTTFRRDGLREFRLWADAICINQSMEPKNHEKSDQVTMMGDIFSNADEVLSWLGESASIPTCFYTILKLHKESANAERNLYPRESDWLKAYPDCYAEDAPNNEKWIAPSHSWASIQNFVELPYWSRMWIFQELMLAQPGKLLFLTPIEPYFITGDDLRLALGITVLSGYYFHQQADPDYIAEDMMEHLIAFCNLGNASQCVYRLLAVRSRLHQKGVSQADRATLCILSAFRHNTRASNPLDYYYSLLGVSQLDLKPNYHAMNQIGSVCVEFVRAYLDATSGSPDTLLFLHDALGSDAKAHSLPSWAPHYHLCGRDSGFHYRGFDYEADRGVFENASGIDGVRARLEGLRLVVEGIRVGTVHRVVNQVPGATNAYRSDFERRNNGHYITGISNETAYFGTLMMDEDFERDGWESRYQYTKRLWSGFSNHDCVKEKDSWRLLKDTYLHSLQKAILSSDEEVFGATSEWSRIRTLSWHARVGERRLFEFEGGYLGLALQDVDIDDVVCVLNGSQYPVILRPSSDGHFEFVGTCFVIGLMKGEARAFPSKRRGILTVV